MRRVLMVHYYFPPLGGIGSLRAARFVSILPEFGWQPSVLAPRHGSYFRDPTLSVGSAHVVRTFSAELSRAGKRMLGERSETTPAAPGPLGRFLRDRVRAWVYRPDAQIGWYPFALSAGRALLREGRFDAVHSSSFPITSHLIARRLAREEGIPWIAEFRDPWAAVMPADHPQRESADRLERSLLADASAVVTVSPTLEVLLREKGARRTSVITNGFDPELMHDLPKPTGFVVTHVGSYYPHMQDLGSLWPALRTLRDVEDGLRLQVRFVGEQAPQLRRDAEAHGLGPELQVTGFVPHDAAVEHMARSSVLVVAGTPRPHPVYDCLLPAKMFEYLGTGRPIIYVGARETDAGRLLSSQPGCWIVPAGNVPATVDALRAIRYGPARFERDLAPFTRRALAQKLAALLEDVARARSA